MYKKIIIINFLILFFGSCFGQKLNYVIPNNLKGVGYAAHIQLTWENRNGYVYEIYRSDDGNSNFSKIAESNKDSYMDFIGKPLVKEQTFSYQIGRASC